jgi:hypothetical protein
VGFAVNLGVIHLDTEGWPGFRYAVIIAYPRPLRLNVS